MSCENKVRNDEIKTDYRGGLSAIKITAKYGISRARVYKILSTDTDYESHREAGFNSAGWKDTRARDELLVRSARENPHKSVRELVEGLDISISRGYQILHRANVFRHKRHSPKNP